MINQPMKTMGKLLVLALVGTGHVTSQQLTPFIERIRFSCMKEGIVFESVAKNNAGVALDTSRITTFMDSCKTQFTDAVNRGKPTVVLINCNNTDGFQRQQWEGVMTNCLAPVNCYKVVYVSFDADRLMQERAAIEKTKGSSRMNKHITDITYRKQTDENSCTLPYNWWHLVSKINVCVDAYTPIKMKSIEAQITELRDAAHANHHYPSWDDPVPDPGVTVANWEESCTDHIVRSIAAGVVSAMRSRSRGGYHEM